MSKQEPKLRKELRAVETVAVEFKAFAEGADAFAVAV
jgi:hypothetical protein